jgi:hypothetical protein
MFDQICRRESSGDLLWFYTEEIYKPHRDFVGELRQNMSAIVEICWGCDVWKEIKKAIGSRLIRLPLWSIFEPVRLYLELDENRQAIRFILRVDHPQFFVRSGIAKLGTEARKKFGGIQDLALTVAIQLAGKGTTTNVQYFQTDQPVRQYFRLTPQQEQANRKSLEDARRTLQLVFPRRYEQREAQKRLRKLELQDVEASLQSLILARSSKPMVKYSREEISQSTLVSYSSGFIPLALFNGMNH